MGEPTFIISLNSIYHMLSQLFFLNGSIGSATSHPIFKESLFNLNVVPVIYDGIWDEDKIREFTKDENREGFVVRVADSFSYGDFRKALAKYVCKKFRTELNDNPNFHWRYKPFKLNKLKETQ